MKLLALQLFMRSIVFLDGGEWPLPANEPMYHLIYTGRQREI